MCGIHLLDLVFSIKIIYNAKLLKEGICAYTRDTYTMYINYIQKHIVQIYLCTYVSFCRV